MGTIPFLVLFMGTFGLDGFGRRHGAHRRHHNQRCKQQWQLIYEMQEGWTRMTKVATRATDGSRAQSGL